MLVFQHQLEELTPGQTPIQHLAEHMPDAPEQKVRTRLGSFGFGVEKALTPVEKLSGGEKALTALALLFAVFMTNPAPICVLDEVDAPLDGANVERFCNLLRDIAEKSETRFLIITHNSITMSRVDRLFGVTMEEAGVSQLVSVNLEQGETIKEAV